MPGDGLAPPVAYSPWWVVLGAALIVAAIVLVVLVVRWTVPTPPSADETDPHAALRAEYARRLTAVEEAYLLDRLDDRTLHLTLAEELRGYASRRLGRDLTAMTVADLDALDTTHPLALALEAFSRPSFAAPDDPHALLAHGDESIERARAVVRDW